MRPVKRTIAASRLILGGTSSSSTDRKGEQRADVLAVRFLQAEHDLEDGQGCPRFHVVGGDVEPVPPVRNGHLRGTGPSFCACPTKFPAVARVQSKGKSGVLQPIMPLDLPVKVRPWELTVYPRSHIRR